MTRLTDSTRLTYAWNETPERALLPTAPADGYIECRIERDGPLVRDALGEETDFVVELVTWLEDLEPTSDRRPLPRPIVFHSPTGFAWGYLGSGPADLAANILALFVSWKEAWRLHQLFKEEVVARIPEAGGRLYCSTIELWLRARWAREIADPDLLRQEQIRREHVEMEDAR